MATRRTLELKAKQRGELPHYNDHDARPYVRERCGALRKIGDGQAPPRGGRLTSGANRG
jgi:hypothetical protein